MRQCSDNLVLVEDLIVLKDQIHVFVEDTWREPDKTCVCNRSFMCFMSSPFVYGTSDTDMIWKFRVCFWTKSHSSSSEGFTVLKKVLQPEKKFGNVKRRCEFTHAVYACLYWTSALVRQVTDSHKHRIQLATHELWKMQDYALIPMAMKCKREGKEPETVN